MPVAETIRHKLTAAFAPLALDVVDESHRHAGHAGATRDDGSQGETHFHVRLVSAAFAGASRCSAVARSSSTDGSAFSWIVKDADV